LKKAGSVGNALGSAAQFGFKQSPRPLVQAYWVPKPRSTDEIAR